MKYQLLLKVSPQLCSRGRQSCICSFFIHSSILTSGVHIIKLYFNIICCVIVKYLPFVSILGFREAFQKGWAGVCGVGGKTRASHLLKQSQRSANHTTFLVMWLLQKAVEVMCIVPKRCNDMMNVGRLQGFDVNICNPFQNIFDNNLLPSNDLMIPSGSSYSLGEDCGTGPPSAAGHLHGVWPRGRTARSDEGEESLPLWAAGHLQWASWKEEGLLFTRLPLQEQHQGSVIMYKRCVLH